MFYMTNFLVLKAHAGITFIAFYQYGRQYNKEVQLPLEKKIITLKIIHPQRVPFNPLATFPRRKESRIWLLGTTKNLLMQRVIVSSVLLAIDSTEGLVYFALQSLNFILLSVRVPSFV